MDVQDLHIFARVAALQNLSAVGVELGLTPGTISKRVQALEDELSVRLFERTTRSIRITAEGATFLQHVETILSELETARGQMADATGTPRGRLKIAAVTGLGARYLVPAIIDFLGKHPEIDVVMDVTDRPVNLQEDGYDLSIHAGALVDSATMSKRLAPDRQVVVATSAYLAINGVPQTPQDLADHQCLVLSDQAQWAFMAEGADVLVKVGSRFRSDDGEVLRAAALSGYGIMRTTELQVRDELESGALQVILANYEAPGNVAVWALYPSGRYLLPRLRVLLDFLTERFRDVGNDGRRGMDRHVRLVERT
jgi:DNA-binding transcriptional LysR family regulator